MDQILDIGYDLATKYCDFSIVQNSVIDAVTLVWLEITIIMKVVKYTLE